MLHFIYRDTLIEDEDLVASSSSFASSTSDTLAGKLLVAADKYGLERLKLMCESYLCKEISVDSVASTLALANNYHAMELKAVCLKFAAENLAGTFLPSAFIFLKISNFVRKMFHSERVKPSNGWCLSWLKNMVWDPPCVIQSCYASANVISQTCYIGPFPPLFSENFEKVREIKKETENLCS